MVSESQFVKIKGFLADAKASGANFLTGGDTPQEKGYFFSPTVITDVGIDDDVWQKEVRMQRTFFGMRKRETEIMSHSSGSVG